MFNLADHIVALTEHRDRELLDVRLTESLMDLLEPFSVAMFTMLADEGTRRWQPLTYLEREGAVEVHDPLWLDAGELPLLAEHPHRARCLDSLQRVNLKPGDGRLLHLTCLPLFTDQRVEGQGVVEIRSEAALPSSLLKVVERLLRVYANMLGMLEYSERDGLTGLLNRKSFDESFYKLLKEPAEDRGRRGALRDADEPDAAASGTADGGTGYWLAMIDIDHFKQVNDRHGHLIGDEVLILVARILKTTFRLVDRVYRFGGEEFVVMLRSRDGVTARQILERFRANMAEHEFPQVGHITASVGLSGILAGDTPTSACERADQAVYHAKHHGRNQVCVHAELARQGLLQDGAVAGRVELF